MLVVCVYVYVVVQPDDGEVDDGVPVCVFCMCVCISLCGGPVDKGTPVGQTVVSDVHDIN